MPRQRLRQKIVISGVTAVAILLAWLIFRASPIPVETSSVRRGPMRVTVDEDGETRAHDRFVIAAPIAGRMLRVDVEEGDAVRKNQIVARIEPLPLNQQQREEVLARIETAEAAERRAEAGAERAREVYEQAQRDLKRAERLNTLISTQALEQARNVAATAAKELEAAKFSSLAAASEVKIARAGLVGVEGQSDRRQIILLRAPVAARALRIVEKSEHVVQAGTPILVLGDPEKIEIVTDVLTTDAVNIKPGAPVFLEGWGGDHPIRARVRLVEPSGFTKISALGVEEKRVNVISDFVDSPDRLSDGYRVQTSIVTWESDDVLQIPGSAPFRDPEGWSVFIIANGRAYRRPVNIGHRNQTAAEVLSGLRIGEHVVLHPSNDLRDGMRVGAN